MAGQHCRAAALHAPEKGWPRRDGRMETAQLSLDMHCVCSRPNRDNTSHPQQGRWHCLVEQHMHSIACTCRSSDVARLGSRRVMHVSIPCSPDPPAVEI